VKEHICFSFKFAAGDSVVFTAAVRDFVKAYGDQFEVSVEANGQEAWHNNPHIIPSSKSARRIVITLIRPSMNRNETYKANSVSPIHFIQAYHNVISHELALPAFPLTCPRPELFLTDKDRSPEVGYPYWVIFPGWKYDIPLKGWNPQYWQETIDVLGHWGIQCVQAGRANLYTPPLDGVLNLTGKTGLRELYRLISNAEGVICGVSQGIHIAAALEKPCVVIGGGREAWWWEAYSNDNPCFTGQEPFRVPHRYLHTLGLLDCCKDRGCWKTHQLQTRKNIPDNQVCHTPATRYGYTGGRCMDMITPKHVVDAVLSYYADRTLTPHSPNLESFTRMLPTNLAAINSPLEILRPDGIRLILNSSNTIPEPSREPIPVVKATPVPLPLVQRLPDEIPELNHPLFGGRITLCVLMYGNYHALHRLCLDSILASTNNKQVEIRVGGNQLCQETLDYLQQLKDFDEIQHIDTSPENRRKYPVMRQLFRTPALTTSWVVWFDDDTICNKDTSWLGKMAQCAINGYDTRCRVVGPHYRYAAWSSKWDEFCKQADWYSGRQWPTIEGKAKPWFPTGSLWMGHVPTILEQNIPDPRIGHNKGDVTIGCQFFQGGWEICDFSQPKNIVNWSSVPRRGITDNHPAEIRHAQP